MYQIEQTDCVEWLRRCPPHSLQAVCTDPPYGILEFTEKELAKLRAGRGGVWRLPPKMGGSHRDPLPRFTVLTEEQKQHLRDYFRDWGRLLLHVLVPGAHVCVAGHPILQHHVQGAMTEAGFEVRPAIMRLYYSFRGGDRPKNAEAEFPEVCVSPKGAYEPWMLFRKPIEARTVAENLRRWKTGALRRLGPDKPLPDAIPSGRTPKCEEAISDHPCLKPQHFMRLMVRALLPLGEGTILDPFMGSGSTIAAAEAVGYTATGLELDAEYFRLAEKAIPRLAALYPHFNGQEIEVELNGTVEREEPETQLALVLAETPPAYGKAHRSTAKTRSAVVFSPGGKAPPFQGRAGEIHTRVVREMKTVLLGENEPAYVDQNSKLLLRAARRMARMLRLAERDIIVGKQSIQWFPWVGTRTLQTLSLMAKSARILHEMDQLSLTYQLPSLEAFLEHLRQITAAAPDPIALARLIAVKAVEKYDDFIAEPLLDEANARSRLAVREAFLSCTTALS